MKIFHRSGFICASLLVLLLTGCCHTQKMGNSSAWLPTGFNPKESPILVQVYAQGANPITAEMIAFMKEQYPYEYKLVSLEDIENTSGLYDADQYPYALIWSVKEENFGKNNNRLKQTFDMRFYDRKADKDYPNTGKSNNAPNLVFKPLIRTIVSKLG
ncbi:MAG: hypothetical protein EOP51_26170 [Sphingobacteriales bacterium]|nr:MAG: hypothetical protein EOP51_26170 [Sphingobacteriales bacterium]